MPGSPMVALDPVGENISPVVRWVRGSPTASLTRYTQPEPEIKLLLEELKLTLPAQAPPKITAEEVARAATA